MHFTGVGEAARNLKLGTAKNWDEIVRMVGDAAKKAKPGEWIIGRGWHQEKWSEVPTANVEGFPVHDALTRVSPDNPVWLTHASGHAGFANALAMKLAEVIEDHARPDGGKILRDKDGNADRADERARAVARRRRAGARPRDAHAGAGRGRPAQRDRAGLARGAGEGAHQVHDAGSPPSTIEVMKRVVDEGKLPLRVWMMLREDAQPAGRRHAEVPDRQLRRQALHGARDQARDRRRARLARRLAARAVRGSARPPA